MSVPITLKAGGDRNVKLEEPIAKAIIERFGKEIIKYNGGTVTCLDISCRSWSQEATDVLTAFIADKSLTKTLRVLNLADCIAGRLTDEGLAIIDKLSKAFTSSDGGNVVVEIDLSDNALGTRAMTSLQPMLNNCQQLQRLYLSNCGFAKESIEMLKNSILNGPVAKNLTDLVLDRNMMGVEGAQQVGELLAQCVQLQYFTYKGCRAGATGTLHICKGLEEMTNSAGFVQLQLLDLDDCGIGGGDGEAVQPLSKALSKCTQLQHLGLCDGEMGVEGLAKIISALTTSKAKLTHLLLEANGELGSEGASILANYLYSQSTSLQTLNVNTCELGDEGTAILLEPFAAARNSLKELSLNMNEIGPLGAHALMQANLHKLERLSLEDNDELPKKLLRTKYSTKLYFGEDDEDNDDGDDDDDDDDDNADNEMDELCKHFATLGK